MGSGMKIPDEIKNRYPFKRGSGKWNTVPGKPAPIWGRRNTEGERDCAQECGGSALSIRAHALTLKLNTQG